MRPTLLSALAALVLPTLLLAGCREAGTEVTGPETELTSAAATGDLVSLENPDPIVIEPLSTRATFTDDVAIQIRDRPDGRPTSVANLRDGSNLFVARITVQPGARFPWHTHPGPVVVAVTQGEFEFVYADDCVERTYAAGTAFVDPGFDNVHFAFNAGTDEVVLMAAFLGAPPEGALTIPVDEALAAELDAKCGVAPASGHSH